VFALSLAPIQNELGDRWAARRDQVWDAFERALARRLPPPDVFLRMNDVTVLAAIASTNAYEGQVRCAEVLRGVLTFFLGRSADDDVHIGRVTGLNDGVLACEPVDLLVKPPIAPPVTEAKPEPAAAAAEHWVPPLSGRCYAIPFENRRGETVPAALEVAPVWRLDHGAVSAYALRRRWRADLPLNEGEQEALDHATVDRLIPLLQEYQREGGVFAVMVPVFFSTISARRSRMTLIERCTEMLPIMRQAVILEIEGLNAGIPPGRITETAAMTRPFVRGLTAKVADAAQAAAVLAEHAFNGAAVQGVKPPYASTRVKGLLTAMRRHTPNVMVHYARRGDEAEDELRRLGATHLTFAEASAA
jgi:hypothetical protein